MHWWEPKYATQAPSQEPKCVKVPFLEPKYKIKLPLGIQKKRKCPVGSQNMLEYPYGTKTVIIFFFCWLSEVVAGLASTLRWFT